MKKTDGYANVDFKSNHGTFWQLNKTMEPVKVHIVSSGDDLPFKDESLDYVVSAHFIEHFFDPIKAIKEWYRVVKDGSYIIMIVPHKARTFDRLRDITPVQELLDRHTGKLTYDDYAVVSIETYQKNLNMQLDDSSLPAKMLVLREKSVIPDGYVSISEREEVLHTHWSVWDTQAFVDMCKAMSWNIVEVLDYDDKVGNGFLVVLQK